MQWHTAIWTQVFSYKDSYLPSISINFLQTTAKTLLWKIKMKTICWLGKTHNVNTFIERVNVETSSKEKEDMLIQIGIRICCLPLFAKSCLIFKQLFMLNKTKHTISNHASSVIRVLYSNFKIRNKIFPLNRRKLRHKKNNILKNVQSQNYFLPYLVMQR